MRSIAMPALFALAACTAGLTESTPTIPPALLGCWTLNDPYIPDHSEQLTITTSAISTTADWFSAKPTKLLIQKVERATDKLIVGMIEYREANGELGLYATEIGIGIRGAPADRLVVVEGDAGSRWFSRCNK